MHSTQLRKQHSHGVFLGTAVGESLGLARRGLSRRSALRHFGPDPLKPQYLPGFGIYGENTRLGFLYAQALLNSRNDMKGLRDAFRWRLSWYPFSFPGRMSYSVTCSALRSWLMRFNLSTGISSRDNAFATRAITSGVVMQGAGHRLVRWAEETTKLTHSDPIAIDCARLYCALASCGCVRPKEFSSLHVLETVSKQTTETELTSLLEQLGPFLEKERSVRAVARHFGWQKKVPSNCLPTAVMATYCFLRYPDNFERAVRSAVLLGGDTSAMGAIVGGLVGAHVGGEALPDLTRKLADFPHGLKWVEELAKRFSHWPHGADDLSFAPAQGSRPLLQIARNISLLPAGLVNGSRRLVAKVSP